MARGTPLKWVQEQGGWTTAKLLLDTYGHYMPSESRGFADVLSAAPDGPQTAPPSEHLTSGSGPGPESAENPDFSEVAGQATSPTSPITSFASRSKSAPRTIEPSSYQRRFVAVLYCTGTGVSRSAIVQS